MPTRDTKLSGPLKSPEDADREEFQALVDESLGAGYDEAKIAAVHNLRLGLRREQTRLAERLANTSLTHRQYLDQLNELLRRVYSECEKILGKRDFEKLFGAPLAEIDHMVDRDLFLGH